MIANQRVNAIWFQRFLHACQHRKGHQWVWIVSYQRLGCTSCLNTITSFWPCIHLIHTHTHTYDPASVLFLGSAYGGPSASSASRLSLNWMQVRDASLPQWNCDVAAWFWVPCIFWYLLLFFLEKVEEIGWMEASGSVAHLQMFRPLACWRWIECPGLGSKVTQFPITHSKGMVLPDEWSLLRRRS